MKNDRLKLELAFDCALVDDRECDVLLALSRVLAESAPHWSADVIAWSANPREREGVDFGVNSEGVADALWGKVRSRTKWAKEERFSGSAELRGSTKDFVTVISVNSFPLARVGGGLLLSNSVTLTTLREKIEGRPKATWMRSIFERMCTEMGPVWGALFSVSEYREKVIAGNPATRAVGRDFSRHLPGIFAVNYFGVKYSEFIGEHRIRSIENGTSSELGGGWLVEVDADPLAWDEAGSRERNWSVVTELGPEIFFSRGREKRCGRAPEWPIPDTQMKRD